MAREKSGGSEAGEKPKGSCILVVEDDTVIRETVRQLLASQGYEVLTAADGSEALQEAQRAKPDLIVLDLGLPSPDPGAGQFDGFTVMKWLELRLPKMIPVIILTARQDEATRQTAKALGVDTFLTKPFRPKELTDAVQAVLNRD